jgi:hypothetical protein
MARRNSFDQASAGFRAHLPDLDSPRFTSAAKQDIYEYTKCMQDNRAPPWLHDLTKVWEKLLEEPYHGVTNDGAVKDGLYEARNEDFDIAGVVNQAEKLLEALDEDQTRKLSYKINAREWRGWSNPEFLLRPLGLRLEEGKAFHGLLTTLVLTCFSPREYRAVYSKRHRSLALAGRLSKGTFCYAYQSLSG